MRWGIKELGAQRLHPTFVMYLYLRAEQQTGQLSRASASSEKLLKLIEMPGNPEKPFYFPLIDRGQRGDNPLPSFWRAPNIPGSWSPGSIRRQPAGSWLSADSSAYAWPEDHAQRAFQSMLYEKPVSALALGAYFLRNDGFILTGSPSAEDLIAAFRTKFRYPPESEEEFSLLFRTDVPTSTDFEWFEAWQGADGDNREEGPQGV